MEEFRALPNDEKALFEGARQEQLAAEEKLGMSGKTEVDEAARSEIDRKFEERFKIS